MRIGFIDKLGWEGGRLYVENLARCLLQLPESERPEVHWFGDSRQLHPDLVRIKRHVFSPPRIAAASRVERWFAIRRIAQREALDFVYPFPGWIGPAVGSAYWIPDLQHRRLPDQFSHPRLLQRNLAYQLGAATAPLTVLSSEAAREDLRTWLPHLDSKVRVLRFATPLALGDVDETSERTQQILAGLPDRFAYVPNQMFRHKDHPTVLRSLAGLRATRRLRVPLVCSGERLDQRHPEWSQQIDGLVRDLGLEKDVFFLGLVPRATQLAVFRRAHVIIQPSLFEGWSTVVEDARVLEKRILLSRIAPNVEQAPEHGTYFDPGDDRMLADGLAQCWDLPTGTPSMPALIANARSRTHAVARNLLKIALEARRP
jgi:glycosyltransferase involved in cell wall biosynthesis